MTLLTCGCEQDGSARCRAHLNYPCHGPRVAPIPIEVVCPPCRIAKWRSVSLSADATPTRSRDAN